MSLPPDLFEPGMTCKEVIWGMIAAFLVCAGSFAALFYFDLYVKTL